MKYIKSSVYYLLPIKFFTVSYYYIKYLPGVQPWKNHLVIYLVVIDNHKEKYHWTKEIGKGAGSKSLRKKALWWLQYFLRILSTFIPFLWVSTIPD